VGRHTPPDMIQDTHTNLFGWIETTGQDSLGSKRMVQVRRMDGSCRILLLGGERGVRIVRHSDPPLL
jgi:hypothetical protein